MPSSGRDDSGPAHVLETDLTSVTSTQMGSLVPIRSTLKSPDLRSMPQGLAGLPGMTGMATKMLKHQIADLDVPEVPEFLQMLSDMGANLWACQMSVDMMGLNSDDLLDEVADVINVGEFMELSEGAQIVFV